MDGVLADSEPLHARAWVDTVVETYGKRLPEDLMATAIGTPDRVFAEILRKRIAVRASPEDFIQSKKKRFFEYLRQGGLKARPGAMSLVQDLRRQGLPFCVASGSGRAEVRASLTLLGLLPLARFFLAHEDVCFRKPHPQIYLEAARRLRLPPSLCLAVEDSPTGLRSAWQAGCYCLGVGGSYPLPLLRPAHETRPSLEGKGLFSRLFGPPRGPVVDREPRPWLT